MLNRMDLQKMKETEEKITVLTAYDYPSAKQVEAADVDMILVGDSLGMVVLGYSSTVQVTLTDMIHHAKAVKRGAKNTFTIVDMPFMSYHISMEKSLENAMKLFQETEAQAIKLEGASPEVVALTKRLSDGGIPVFAHLGLTPQTVHVLGGYKVQGKDKQAAEKLLNDAVELEASGAIGLVLECVPKELAKIVTSSISIPTIGIGAGNDCDGQVLVYHDILQYGTDRLPKFVKPYGDVDTLSINALQTYIKEVKNNAFPAVEQTFFMKNKANLPSIKNRM